jgi:hypothetical protein
MDFELKPLWWLSFVADEGGNLGVAFVHADEFEEALERAWDLEINPGGSAQGFPLPDEARSELAPLIGRLLSEQELHDAGVATMRTQPSLGDYPHRGES